MSRRVSRVALLPLLTLLLVPQASEATGVGPQVGYYKATDADEGEFMFGGALRIHLSKFFGVEGSINYRQEKYADDQVTVKSWPVMATALVYPLPVVYGLAGGGWYNVTIDYDEDLVLESQTDNQFGYHFGGGVELPLGQSALIVADIRYVFLDYEFEEFPGSGDTDANFYVITIGLLLGGR
ncbi:MAG: outer membrane beta-barrel protein [Candidatus Eisenbacteria bacterium]